MSLKDWLENFKKGSNAGFDESINVIKGEKTVIDAMKSVKDTLSPKKMDWLIEIKKWLLGAKK